MPYIDEYHNLIRFALKDFKEKNKLLVDENDNPVVENSKDEINAAITFVRNDAEVSPPLHISQSLEAWTKHLFFTWGVMAFLLDAESIMNFRNVMPISDGGVNIEDNYKANPFSTIAINMWAKYAQGLKEFKVHWNLMNFSWGGTGDSDPWSRGRYY